MNTRQASVVALALCAVSDLAAAPLLLGSNDVPSGVGIGVVAIAVLTLLAAAGIGRGTSYAGPLALTTRAIDVLGLIPLLAGGQEAGVYAAGATTLALSIVAVALVRRAGLREGIA